MLYRRAGCDRDAIVDLTLAAGVGHPQSAWAMHLRAHAHERLSRWEQAAADFDAALSGQGGGTVMHLKAGRGINRARAGRFDEALVDLTEVVNLGPPDDEYRAVPRQSLARLHLVVGEKKRDLKHAREIAETLVRESPQNATNLRTLGRVLLALGEHDKAQEQLEACLNVEGKAASSLTWFALAACRHKLGKTAPAREALRNGRARMVEAAWSDALSRREAEAAYGQAKDLLGKESDDD
jgi:tetratricopeptide (TPR) repeat protein